jgi:hypothetical protein
MDHTKERLIAIMGFVSRLWSRKLEGKTIRQLPNTTLRLAARRELFDVQATSWSCVLSQESEQAVSTCLDQLAMEVHGGDATHEVLVCEPLVKTAAPDAPILLICKVYFCRRKV